jgi:endonuclease/exonuclease/phosphatase family metal-dependent hydrolase
VWNTHLGLKAEERNRQAAHILKDGFPENALLCGDMNESTRGLGMRQVLTLLGESHDEQLCIDPTFPAGSPRVRIDHVFAGKGYTVRNCQVVRNPQTALASDHLPIVAEIVPR